MVKVVFFDPFRQWDDVAKALNEFPNIEFVHSTDNASLVRALEGAQVMVTGNRGYDAAAAAVIRERGTALRWIQFTTSGTDKAFANGLPSGIVVTNVAGLRAFSVAEQAFTLMLGLVRCVRESEAARAREAWIRDDLIPRADNLSGKHLAIIGLGAIGQEVARKAKAFDMQVTGISQAHGPFANIDRVRPRSDIVSACSEADFVLMAALYRQETDKLLSRDAIAAMKRSAYVINIARGPLIDEPALVQALASGRIAGAGLDVTVEEPLPAGNPLWSMPNVLLTPHLGGAGSDGAGESIRSIVVRNLERWLAGQKLAKIIIERTP